MKIIIKPWYQQEGGFAATTAALIMAGVAVAGAATSAAGAMAQASAQKQASDFNAKVAQNNAQAQSQQAMADANRIKQQGDRLRGKQVATLAAAGVDPNSGSGSAITYDSKVQNELDQLTTIYKGQVAAGGDDSQATLDRMQGRGAVNAGYLQAGGTLIQGAGAGIYDYSSVRNNPSFGDSEQNFGVN